MPARVGVVVYPGSNCEHDAIEAVTALGAEADLVWHTATDLAGYDAVILPGGFAHGDYLRPGAIARFSPVMGSVTLRWSRAASTSSRYFSRSCCASSWNEAKSARCTSSFTQRL